ncbi:MAG: hypothetical protein KAG98_03500 [Lentisphaeria bacterium]|nr:hypothetical protein [Lentisphaeria bacterium]
MQASNQLKVNRLLRHREELFESVMDSEVEIASIFGSNKIIPLPPELPSIFRHSRVRKSTKSKSVTVRRLNNSEDCFRILLEVRGEEREDFVQDVRLVRRLIELNLETVTLKKIETVNMLDSGEIIPLELLYFNRDFLRK